MLPANRVALFLGNSCGEDKRDRQFYDITLASYARLCASALSSLLKRSQTSTRVGSEDYCTWLAIGAEIILLLISEMAAGYLLTYFPLRAPVAATSGRSTLQKIGQFVDGKLYSQDGIRPRIALSIHR